MNIKYKEKKFNSFLKIKIKKKFTRISNHQMAPIKFDLNLKKKK